MLVNFDLKTYIIVRSFVNYPPTWNTPDVPVLFILVVIFRNYTESFRRESQLSHKQTILQTDGQLEVN